MNETPTFENPDPLWNPRDAAIGFAFIVLVIALFEVVPRLIARRLGAKNSDGAARRSGLSLHAQAREDIQQP